MLDNNYLNLLLYGFYNKLPDNFMIDLWGLVFSVRKNGDKSEEEGNIRIPNLGVEKCRSRQVRKFLAEIKFGISFKDVENTIRTFDCISGDTVKKWSNHFDKKQNCSFSVFFCILCWTIIIWKFEVYIFSKFFIFYGFYDELLYNFMIDFFFT